jgi:hypothetical protein
MTVVSMPGTMVAGHGTHRLATVEPDQAHAITARRHHRHEAMFGRRSVIVRDDRRRPGAATIRGAQRIGSSTALSSRSAGQAEVAQAPHSARFDGL